MNDEISTGEHLFSPKNRIVTAATVFACVFLTIYTLFIYFFAFIPIIGSSMENNIFDGNYCLAQRKMFDIECGDIVTIETADKNEEEHLIIKRVIGTAGDKVLFMKTQNMKNVELYICKSGEKVFSRVDEPYIKEKMIPDELNNEFKVFIKIKPIEFIPGIEQIDLTSDNENISEINRYAVSVPENSIFALGDNRNVSRDGRYYGTFELDKVTSKILAVI